jgi:ribosomal protein S18 acetylase RimI-like enzyme
MRCNGLYVAAVAEAAIDIYCDGFVAPNRHELDSEPVVHIAPGMRGVAHIRRLVTDDAGYDLLVTEVASAQPGVVFVFEHAPRCNGFLHEQPGWSADATEMAMVLRDIEDMSSASLPDGLELRPVDRLDLVAPDAVPLKDVVTAAIRSDPGITDAPDRVAGYLSGLPPSVRIYAAVDETGAVRATSACHVFGEYTQIFFVSTEPAWRQQGIGGAMTAGALRGAASLGAHRAFLHSTADGASVYRRLGFEAVGLLTRYSHTD